VPIEGAVKNLVYLKLIFKQWINRIKSKTIPYFFLRCYGRFPSSLRLLLKKRGTKEAKNPTTESFRGTSVDVKKVYLHLVKKFTFRFLKPKETRSNSATDLNLYFGMKCMLRNVFL
jgi:hypothetical protein